MTLREAIYDALGIIGAGNPSDDLLPSEEQVATWIIQSGASLMRQLYDRQKAIPEMTVLNVCLELEIVDASVCCGWEAGCEVLRSVEEIPTTMVFGTKTDGIQAVSSLDLAINYDRTTAYRMKYDRLNKFRRNSLKPMYFILGNRVYLTMENPLLNRILIRVIPEDPIKWLEIEHCDQGDCPDPWDKEYPLPLFIMKTAIEEAASKGLNVRKVPEDTKNDAKDTKQ